jgi:hypothetical protein
MTRGGASDFPSSTWSPRSTRPPHSSPLDARPSCIRSQRASDAHEQVCAERPLEDNPPVDRTTSNAWEDADFLAAVRATARRSVSAVTRFA